MEKLHDVLPHVEHEIVDIIEEDNTCILRVHLKEERDAIEIEWLHSFQQRSTRSSAMAESTARPLLSDLASLNKMLSK